jgi:hypothetical protein
VAAAAGLSCGAGIHGDEGWYYVSGSIDSSGGQLVLREGTLIVARNCVEEAVPITLRRQDRIDHSGAIGPVFTIEVPSPTTFVNDPQINIATSAAVASSASSTIGYIVNTEAGPQ